MRTSQIEIFLAIVRHGTVAAAARELGRSRTTVSTALAALEDELGVELFERSGNQLHLTPIGGAIVTDCRRLEQVAAQIRSRCVHHLSGAESVLRIARDDSLPEPVWRAILRRLKARFPVTSVSVYLAPPRELAPLVERQAVDVAYGLIPELLSEGYQWFRELADVGMVTVAAPGHPLSSLPRVEQDDLVNHTEITLAYLDNDLLVAESPETANFLAFTQYELIRDAVIDGAGWADLPLPLVADALRDGTLQAIRHRSAHWWKTFSALESEQAQGGAVVTWLANELEEYLRQY
ncbi:LysR family transcriptional regulator [Alkalilimnicola ehrlichii]|uniref:LysR family transcriptional regulator n=1 Tax=Alkalilimnicola ehrlichii TaxID=351052 RepID=A0A3E0WLH0_9GAMM|nr:LysR family transcriptional regulator [Alkalilimnicola ehrlichii]RFA25744.1 LysR family transcriptional regulator [Alkalilimnicola ehrlichii]RFA32826.1 LysR family transcriptional regulator [Alkalilimnicola ehrlichii]